MKIYLKLVVISAFFLPSLALVTPWCLAGELIGPTRTLQEAGKHSGKLTVVSEPSNLDVFLDGSNIGKTPLWLKELTPGLHTLQVSNSQTEIHVEHGKILQVSLFKGSFVNVTREEKKAEQKQAPEEKRLAEGRQAIEPLKEKRKSELTLWDQFINGSSRHF
jgi:hypothetical protein